MMRQQRFYLPKGIIGNNVIINGKNVYDQVIDPDVKQYEKIRKLTTGQGDDYATECLQIIIISKIITD